MVTFLNKFVTTYLYSVILSLGLATIIFTINILFAINISSRIYEMICVDSKATVEVLYTFSNISGMEDSNGEVTIYSLIFYIFVKIR